MVRLRFEKPINISLRLWSERISLAPVVERLGFAVEHLMHRGDAIERNGQKSGRAAQRHYASIAQNGAVNEAETSEWCRTVMRAIAADAELESLLQTQTVDATLWVAVLRPIADDRFRLPEDVVEQAKSLALTLFVEDYTAEGLESPSKLWLTKPRPLVHSAI